jgi:hypothetical protein
MTTSLGLTGTRHSPYTTEMVVVQTAAKLNTERRITMVHVQMNIYMDCISDQKKTKHHI